MTGTSLDHGVNEDFTQRFTSLEIGVTEESTFNQVLDL